MRKFITELKGKTVMTNDGQILGMIENFLVNTASGDIQNVLVVPAEEVETRLYKTDALFVIYPSQRGGWSAQCVTDHKTKKPKLPFPQSWAGQPQEVIEQKSGIEGISFCHASRFLITAKDKETALAACRQVLKNNGRI